MVFFRKRLTEDKAAAYFVQFIAMNVEKEWPSIKNSFKEIFKKKIPIADEKKAIFDLFLAAIAMELQAAITLFSAEQSERLSSWVLKLINVDDCGGYALEEIINYNAAFHNNVKTGENPIEGIAIILLMHWFGNKLQKYYVKVGDKEYLSPILLMFITERLLYFSGYWKRINENYKLVMSDLPI